MRNIYIHIGLEKTGSTAIQNSIQENRSRLSHHGYYVPETGMKSRHHFEIARALGFSFQTDCTEVSSASILSRFLREVEACGKDNILISSEHFDVNANVLNCENLANFFSQFRISIIMCLRNQIDYCQSLYTEHIKWGGTIPFRKFLRKLIRSGSTNYNARYNQWRAVADEVIVIDYEAHDSNIIGPFFEALPLDGFHPNPPAASNRSNSSLSPDFMELVRQFNQGCSKPEGRRNFETLEKSFAKHSAALLEPRQWRFPDGFRPFIEAASAQNCALAEKLEVDEKEFLGGSLTKRFNEKTSLDEPSISPIIGALNHSNGAAVI